MTVLATAAFAAAFAAQADPDRGQAIMGTMSPEEKAVFLEQFGALFVDVDPFRGREFAMNLPEGERRAATWTQLCKVFAVNENEVQRMYSQTPSGAGRADAITALAVGCWKRDQQKAANWAELLPPDDRAVAVSALQRASAQIVSGQYEQNDRAERASGHRPLTNILECLFPSWVVVPWSADQNRFQGLSHHLVIVFRNNEEGP
jgi:hypothetical protein